MSFEVFFINILLLSFFININTMDIPTKWEDPISKTKFDFSSLVRPSK
ncbi:MAG: hypothetical protein MJ252_07745 [archaeon]|nr:hypothetical protein [archaeon]